MFFSLFMHWSVENHRQIETKFELFLILAIADLWLSLPESYSWPLAILRPLESKYKVVLSKA